MGRTIGAVLADLREDFPGLTISKIRFLEAEGLVVPSRTASGYRTYSSADVERLRYVLTAQRDRFWPLKVIRESLDALDRGLVTADDDTASTDGRPRAPRVGEDPDVPTATALGAPSRVRLTTPELAAAAEVDEGFCADLLTCGLITPGRGGHFADHDLAVVRAAAGLAAYGLTARHLRSFRTAADREVGIVEQALGARREGHDGAVAAEVAALCVRLHAALVKGALGADRR